MVASSHFHTARAVDFLSGLAGDILAGGIFVASPAAVLARCGCDLRHFIRWLRRGGGGRPAFTFPTATALQRQALWLGFLCLVVATAFLGFLSIIYDFQDCFYPSRAHPYFTSGRLMLGALIPFLLLYLYGLDCALSRIKNRWAKPLALAGLILFMLISEIATDRMIFSNSYNWFHM